MAIFHDKNAYAVCISAGCILTVKKPGVLSLVSIMTSPPAPTDAPLSQFLASSQKVSAPKVWFQDSKPQRHRNSGFQNVCFLQHVWARMHVLGSSVDLQLAPTRRPQPEGPHVFLRKKWTSICRMSQNATNSDQNTRPSCKAAACYRSTFF